MKAWLLESVDADVNGMAVPVIGGPMTLWVYGTDYGGGTVSIEATPDNGTTWIALTIDGSPAAFTANALRVIEGLSDGVQIRAILSGATDPDNVNVRVT